MKDSELTPEEKQKVDQTLDRIQDLCVEKYKEEHEQIHRVFAEIIEDPYYKENMNYYFGRILDKTKLD